MNQTWLSITCRLDWLARADRGDERWSQLKVIASSYYRGFTTTWRAVGTRQGLSPGSGDLFKNRPDRSCSSSSPRRTYKIQKEVDREIIFLGSFDGMMRSLMISDCPNQTKCIYCSNKIYFHNVQMIQCKYPAPGHGLQLLPVTRVSFMFVMITAEASSSSDNDLITSRHKTQLQSWEGRGGHPRRSRNWI